MKETIMRYIPDASASLLLFLLSACASAQPKAPTDMTFHPAAIARDSQQPVKIVAVAQPLPLPGQLQPYPKAIRADGTMPATRVGAANRQALIEPTRDGYINAMQVYPFTTGALYRLYAAPQKVSDIALQSGETLVAISAGDTVRWVVGDTTSGTGASKQVHILAKPFAAGLKTNLVITTDRRSYHLELESTDHTYIAALSWTYPEDELIALKAQNDAAVAAAPVDTGLSLDTLNFNYAISGDDASWKPLRAFDDGRHVYIEFPKSLAEGDAPPLFVRGQHGSNDLVNYRVRDNYYIVDHLFSVAELRLGKDKQQVVRIARGENTPQRLSRAESSKAIAP
jgi:P-type conjugative transfer protein TrbG